MTVMEAHKGKHRPRGIALGADMKISERDHIGAPQRSSVMGQRWKLLFVAVSMHWAQVWRTVMGQEWSP